MNNVLTFCFDIDQTICLSIPGDYASAEPLIERIDKINQLFDEGNYIIFSTARGSLLKQDFTELTQSQLAAWGVKYHELHMGKPVADYYIDDKAVTDIEFFG